MDGNDGERPDPPFAAEELFGILGNATRIRVLRILWEEFDFQDYVTRQQEPTSFSTLQERAHIDDSGNFNYHLGKLEGALVEHREQGYVLTPLGYNFMRAITTFAAYEYRTIEPAVLEEPCPFCGGELRGSYEREFVTVRCTACDGLADGRINSVQCRATDVKSLDLRTMLDAATLRLMNGVRTSGYGFCGKCYSLAETTLDVCENHTPDGNGVCEGCLHRFGVTMTVECRHCGSGGQGPLLEYTLTAPSVLSFFEARDSGPQNVGPWRYRLAGLTAVTETLREVRSPGAVYAFSVGDDSHRVVVEEGNYGIYVRPAPEN